MIRGCIVALTLLVSASPVCAQDGSALATPGRVAARYELADPSWLDRMAMARRVAELAGVTLEEGEAVDGWLLVVVMTGPEAARVTLHRPQAEPLEREVVVPDHGAERTEVLAIVAANLLRDEAAELLALLAGPPITDGGATTEPDAAVEGAAVEGAAVEDATSVEASAEPDDTESAETASSPEDAEDAEGATNEPAAAPGPPWLRLGLGAHLTSVPAGGGTEADVFYGIEIAWTAPQILAIGVRDVSAGGLPGRDGAHIDASPFAEAAWSISFFSLYGQLGAHLQVVIEDADGHTRMGVAPFVDLGARFQLDPVFSLALETMLRLVATDELTTSAHQLPTLSLPWSVGITALFHLR